MSFTTSMPRAVSSNAFEWRGHAWRMVEAQHIAATMKLVDDIAEQILLEDLLESSKPAQPDDTDGLNYLLATPFRYSPRRGGSRFRAETDPGVFYGAESIRTAAAELGYWRWKFLMDAVELEGLEPMPHTAFRVSLATSVIDLQKPPFDADAATWQHPTDYALTQQLASVARKASVGGIQYRSVRDSSPSWCLALLTPKGFAAPQPDAQQTWFLTVSSQNVTVRRGQDGERDTVSMLQFPVSGWR